MLFHGFSYNNKQNHDASIQISRYRYTVQF
ncbi:hypothetical protein vBEcoMWL3_gp245 [Escherichia phage vB_EcoM_WL-3]|nr:hypothetical protein vBEcoMWL3_gp245 [Escherichia phage vB_EcoM_WL-3]